MTPSTIVRYMGVQRHWESVKSRGEERMGELLQIATAPSSKTS